jgi:hypothetical protein
MMLGDMAPTLFQYWHREEIPEPIAGVLASFREHNPTLRQLVFNERTAAEFIEEHYGTRHADAFRSCLVPAMQSDYFRFCSVHACGGVYADANLACLKPLESLLESEVQLFELPPLGPILASFFIFRAPGHPLLGISIEAATRNIERRVSNISGLMGGPAILSGLYLLHRGYSPRERMPKMVHPGLRTRFEACIDEVADSMELAIEKHGSLAGAFDGVRISTKEEMHAWVKKPRLNFKNPDGHWGTWKGPAYRSVAKDAS